MKMEYNKYVYTKKWFNENTDLKNHLHTFIDTKQKLTILEIGCYEGLCSCYFSDNYLEHKDSNLYCVDPFYEIKTVSNLTEKLFLNNLMKSKHRVKIIPKKISSQEFFENIDTDLTFDIIYVDGDHSDHAIQGDIKNCFEHVKQNSIIWFDDYVPCKSIIDSELKKYNHRFTVIFKNYQLGIKIL